MFLELGKVEETQKQSDSVIIELGKVTEETQKQGGSGDSGTTLKFE